MSRGGQFAWTTAIQAQENLKAAGLQPRLLVGDAAAASLGGPFDRIIATCAIETVPDQWITQLQVGGRLVAPCTLGAALLVLDKTSEHTLEGRVDEAPVSFMAMRDTPNIRPADGSEYLIGTGSQPPTRTISAVDPEVLRDNDFRLWLAICHPHLRIALSYTHGTGTSLVYTRDHSASIDHQHIPGGWNVTQDEGRLWATIEAGWAEFDAAARPRRDLLRASVTQGGGGIRFTVGGRAVADTPATPP